MGYYFTLGAGKKDVISEVTRDFSYDNTQVRTIKKSIRGNQLWTIREEITPTSTTRIIMLYLLRKVQGSWGYKSMCEQNHPFYYNCPVSYLDEVPEACPEWRAKVRQHHQKSRQTLQENDVVQVVNAGISYMWLDKKVGRNWRGFAENGVYYRLPTNMKGVKVGTANNFNEFIYKYELGVWDSNLKDILDTI